MYKTVEGGRGRRNNKNKNDRRRECSCWNLECRTVT